MFTDEPYATPLVTLVQQLTQLQVKLFNTHGWLEERGERADSTKDT